jgi:8-oxo-dGTP pyrophosphatase MutT (NUDIX family)
MDINMLRKLIREVIAPYAGTAGSYPLSSSPLHHGSPIKLQGTNSASDVDKQIDRPTAACVLVKRQSDGLYLAVSRRDDPCAFGLPGGKVDLGEEPAHAAARELKEETGLTLVDPRLVFLSSDGDYLTYTFVGHVTGRLATSETGVVKWVNKLTLLSGPFGDYNRRLLDHLRL